VSKITDNKFYSREEATFAEIMDRIQAQNPDMGGVFLEALGMQGVGKTSVIIAFCEDTILNHPDQKNFFRNPYFAPLQFLKLTPHTKWEIMLEEGSRVTFHDRDDKLAEINIDNKIKYFKDFNELYDKATPGKCTAVFFEDEVKWYDFIHFLRGVGEWCHIYLDEYGELFPANPSGELYRKIMDAASDLKEARKCMMNVYATTQVTSDVDYRIRNKIMTIAYLYGSRPVGRSRVTQQAIDALDRDIVKGNQVWLEEGFGKFGRGRFTKIYKPIKGMNWQAHKPDDSPKITDYLRKTLPPGRPSKEEETI